MFQHLGTFCQLLFYAPSNIISATSTQNFVSIFRFWSFSKEYIESQHPSSVICSSSQDLSNVYLFEKSNSINPRTKPVKFRLQIAMINGQVQINSNKDNCCYYYRSLRYTRGARMTTPHAIKKGATTSPLACGRHAK